MLPGLIILLLVAWTAPQIVPPAPTTERAAATAATDEEIAHRTDNADEPKAPVPAMRFTTVSLVLVSDTPVAAWQVTVRRNADADADSDADAVAGGAPRRSSTIVGLEGGHAPPWTAPPRHDPAALSQDVLILGAWHLGTRDALIAGRAHVATLHLQVPVGIAVPFTAQLDAAADADGQPIHPEVMLIPGVPAR
ncbi:MAG: hypothetical protein AB8G96_03085 [Phycisphaerales bacterium]